MVVETCKRSRKGCVKSNEADRDWDEDTSEIAAIGELRTRDNEGVKRVIGWADTDNRCNGGEGSAEGNLQP